MLTVRHISLFLFFSVSLTLSANVDWHEFATISPPKPANEVVHAKIIILDCGVAFFFKGVVQLRTTMMKIITCDSKNIYT